MANLLITIIGIAFCALLLVAGANFISPQAFVTHNQAELNTSQVESLVSDYNNLQMAVGHRPSYSDYSNVYANGSANIKYTNANGVITSSATMASTNANGATVPIGTWQFVPGCGTGSLQDCFCINVTSANATTYQATKVSALAQMNGTSQSRIEYSKGSDGCATNTVTNPAQWPGTDNGVPQSYWLTVRLSPSQSSTNYTAPVASNGSNPADPTSPTYALNLITIPGACAPNCSLNSTRPLSYECIQSDGVQIDNSSCPQPQPPTGSCADYSLCSAQPNFGSCSCTPPYQKTYNGTWSCQGNGNYNLPQSDCSAPTAAQTQPETCTPSCPQQGQCGTSGVNSCAQSGETASITGPNAWTCSGLYGGGPSGTCTYPLNGSCGTSAANTCGASGETVTVGTAPNTWTCSGLYGGTTSGQCTYPLAGTCGTTLNTCGQSGETATVTGTDAWTCSGLYGGASSATCQILVNAACGTTPNNCTAGQPAYDYNILSGTWTCDGIDGGANASCLLPNPGVCSTTTLDQCTSGLASGTTPGGVPVGSETDWNCSSLNGGATAYCKAVNGLCYNPTKNCSSGFYAAGTDNGTTTTWTCTGSPNGGTSASCSTYDAVNGVCGTAIGTCNPGTSTQPYNGGNGTTVWFCQGSYYGTTASCSAPDIVNGASCGTTADTCVPASNSGQSYNASAGTWTCADSTGNQQPCALAPINGACGTTADTCVPASTSGQSYNASAGTWTCPGSYGGTAASCSAAATAAGCNYTTSTPQCQTGSATNISNTDTQSSWDCGADACQLNLGVCTTTLSLCAHGIEANTGLNTWTCASYYRQGAAYVQSGTPTQCSLGNNTSCTDSCGNTAPGDGSLRYGTQGIGGGNNYQLFYSCYNGVMSYYVTNLLSNGSSSSMYVAVPLTTQNLCNWNPATNNPPQSGSGSFAAVCSTQALACASGFPGAATSYTAAGPSWTCNGEYTDSTGLLKTSSVSCTAQASQPPPPN